MAGAGLVLSLLACPASAARSAAPKSTTPPEGAGLDGFTLPENYKNADGSFNQEALVAQQKRRLDTINGKIGTKMRLAETPHYLIFSDADPALSAQFVKWSEALYANLRSQFAIDAKERVWDGKCLLMLFNGRPRFEQYSKVFDGHNVADAGAFFAWESYSDTAPQLVHICIPLDDRDPQHLQELFAHEGTHAFFQLYRKPVELPLWLHEGLAEYMTVLNNPLLKPMKSSRAGPVARSPTPLDRLIGAATGDNLTLTDYSVSFTLVDFLVTTGKARFKKFVDLLKDGQDLDTALKTAYGFDSISLEIRWATWMQQNEAGGVRRR